MTDRGLREHPTGLERGRRPEAWHCKAAPASSFNTVVQPLKHHISPPTSRSLPSPKAGGCGRRRLTGAAGQPARHRGGLPACLPPSLPRCHHRRWRQAGGGRKAARRAARPAPAGFPVRAAPPERRPSLPGHPFPSARRSVYVAPAGGAEGRDGGTRRGREGRGAPAQWERSGEVTPPLRAAPAPAAPERGWACGVTATAPSRAPAQAARESGAGSAGEEAAGAWRGAEGAVR